MNYIFTMTLSGSSLFLVYGLLRLVLYGRMSEKWYYRLLKVTALYFLIPLPFLKKLYVNFLDTWQKAALQVQGKVYHQEDWIVFVNVNFLKLNNTLKIQGTILSIWVLGALLVGLGFLVLYFRRRIVLKDCYKMDVPEAETSFRKQMCQRYGIHTDVDFMYYSQNSPFTIGFLRPIVFYDYKAPSEVKEMLLAHELIHIKRIDTLWHLVSILVVAMHWYNPLAWWFKYEIEEICEYSCDEQVVCDKDEAYRKRYAGIILKYATEQKGEALSVGFSKAAKEVKRRMKKVLDKTKKISKIAATMIMAVVVALNSLTVFAYEDVKVARGEAIMEEMFFENDFAFVPEGEELVWSDLDYIQNYVLHYDTQFVDVEGNVYEVCEGVEVCATCEHTYVSGTLQAHEKYSNGGCKVYYYSAMRCTKCGSIINKVYLGSTEYVTCPH